MADREGLIDRFASKERRLAISWRIILWTRILGLYRYMYIYKWHDYSYVYIYILITRYLYTWRAEKWSGRWSRPLSETVVTKRANTIVSDHSRDGAPNVREWLRVSLINCTSFFHSRVLLSLPPSVPVASFDLCVRNINPILSGKNQFSSWKETETGKRKKKPERREKHTQKMNKNARKKLFDVFLSL